LTINTLNEIGDETAADVRENFKPCLDTTVSAVNVDSASATQVLLFINPLTPTVAIWVQL